MFKAVLRIRNEMDMTLVELNDLLPVASVMVISVTGSTTSGKELIEKDLNNVIKACNEVLLLNKDREKNINFYFKAI